jgi:hypothetical protein
MKTLARIILMLGVVASPAFAQDYTTDKPAAKAPPVVLPLTDEQKAALRAVDVRVTGLEALVAKIDDPTYRTKEAKAVADMKKRRAELAKNFDPMTYETLMHSVISRYQVIALWLTPPRLPGPGQKAEGNSIAPPAKGAKAAEQPAAR